MIDAPHRPAAVAPTPASTSARRPGGVIAWRVLLLAHAMAALLFAIWIGLVRLGWVLPLPRSDLYAAHGPLMVCGFFGTLISLERAVAAPKFIAYLAPAASAAATALTLFLAPSGTPYAGVLFVVASATLVLLTIETFAKHRTLFHAAAVVGAAAWLAGTALWLKGWPVFRVVPFWMSFLVVTVLGERLELSRLAKPTPGRSAWFAAAMIAMIGGAVVSCAWAVIGNRIVAAGSLGFATWLFRYDLARRTIRTRGLTRFMAMCLMSGYVWVGVSGAIGLGSGLLVAGPLYDAVLHCVFVGFTLSMVFGHASIVFPAVLGLMIRYSARFWAHLVLLEASLAVRIGADLAGAMTLRRWAGLINGVAILVFVANTVLSLRSPKGAARATAR